jgi:hypothetical protein
LKTRRHRPMNMPARFVRTWDSIPMNISFSSRRASSSQRDRARDRADQAFGVGSRLVISHETGDEGMDYQEHVRSLADLFGVNVMFSSDVIGVTRGVTPDGRKIYSLEDIYPFCDLVTYPSLWKGFGNAFLEAVYFRKPMRGQQLHHLLHRYSSQGFQGDRIRWLYYR